MSKTLAPSRVLPNQCTPAFRFVDQASCRNLFLISSSPLRRHRPPRRDFSEAVAGQSVMTLDARSRTKFRRSFHHFLDHALAQRGYHICCHGKPSWLRLKTTSIWQVKPGSQVRTHDLRPCSSHLLPLSGGRMPQASSLKNNPIGRSTRARLERNTAARPGPHDKDAILADWTLAVATGSPYLTQGWIWSRKHGTYRAFQTRGSETQIPTMRGMQSFCPAHIAFCWRATGKLRLHHISANETCNLR